MNSTTPTRTTAQDTAANWPLGLVAVLAIMYLLLGLSAGAIGLLGIGGAIAVVAALLVAARSRTRSAASVVLVLGALPFALATWWSLVVPLTALLIIGVGLPQIKRLAGQSSLDKTLAT